MHCGSRRPAKPPRAGRILLLAALVQTGAGPASAEAPSPAEHTGADAWLAWDARLLRQQGALGKLIPREDGGYSYREAGFAAEIEPDGTLTFTDKHGSLSWERQLSFDLTDSLLLAVGEDPHTCVKRRFLEQVAPLQEELRRRAGREQQVDALTGLRQELEALWQAEQVPAQERRSRIFGLWDSCNDSEIGLHAQQLIAESARGQPAGLHRRGAGRAQPEEDQLPGVRSVRVRALPGSTDFLCLPGTPQQKKQAW